MIETVFRTRVVPYTELVLSLLTRTPDGMTSGQLGGELSITSDGANRVCQKLHAQGRIDREIIHSDRRNHWIFIWRAKTHA